MLTGCGFIVYIAKITNYCRMKKYVSHISAQKKEKSEIPWVFKANEVNIRA